ncbi:hypothetical protein PR048_015594 [Dryococelus australis]|uniref:Uncharacterized protein n=1 Tax=Dryococelus australis TaxID=614101 RepID=A0ABQ9HHD3_9NEOP|nr:hypothetical protein PR048_015594 [Dryococelus australis]
MWVMYLEKHEPKIILLMKTNKDSKPPDNERRVLATNQELHLRKAGAFYDDLKEKSSLSKNDLMVETLCLYYQHNWPVPLLTTNEVFYARQVWVYNRGFLGCSNYIRDFYMYDETAAREGSAETVSFFKHYIENTRAFVVLFTDNCAGQNKNRPMVRFLLALVNLFFPVTKTSRILKKERRGSGRAVCERLSRSSYFTERCAYLKIKLQPHFKKSATYNRRPFSISKYKVFNYDEKFPD